MAEVLNLSQASPRLVQPAPSVVLFALARYIYYITDILYHRYIMRIIHSLLGYGAYHGHHGDVDQTQV